MSSMQRKRLAQRTQQLAISQIVIFTADADSVMGQGK